jgi:leader peptidase (prepilin peptidase)/N-methyltransferase
MTLLLATSFALLGAVIASFMGVVAARLNTGQGFVTGTSRCDACGKSLSPVALVPVLSYIGTEGRAQCCGARISLLAPLSEVLLAALFALSYVSLGLTSVLPCLLVALSLLLSLVLYDLAHQILPSELLYPFVAVSALTGYLASPSAEAFRSQFLIALCIGGSLAIIHLLSRGRAMGLADAPLAFGLALLTGAGAPTGFLFSFWIGAVVGIVLLLGRRGGLRMNSEVPFAPFLAAGFLLAYFTQWNLFTYIAVLR